MPTYSYECEICDSIKDSYNTIAQRHNAPKCNCGQSMVLKIMPTHLQPILGGGDWPGYKCVVTDKFVSSRKQRREIMAEHNLVETS